MDYQVLIRVSLLLLWLAIPRAAEAMEHLSQALQDQNGRAISGATVTVYQSGTATLATLYSDNGVTVKPNPFTTGIDGIYDFYAADGVYDLVFFHAQHLFAAEKSRRIALFDAQTFIIQTGPTFPTAPVAGTAFVLTTDDISGSCTPGVGISITLCRYDGSVWAPLGNGTGGGGTGGGTTGWPSVISGSAATSEAAGQSIKILGQGGQASNGLELYQGSDGRFYIVCLVGGVRKNCDVINSLNAGFKYEWLNSSGTPIFTLTNNTNALTNITIDCTAASNNCTMMDERHWAVVTCQNGTASTNFDTPTTNAPTPQCEGSNYRKGVLAFNDTTDQGFHDQFILPVGFAYATFEFRVKAASTSGTFGLCVRLARVALNSTSDPAKPAQAGGNCVSATINGTTLTEQKVTITSPTCTSCAAGDRVQASVERDADASAVGDTMTGDLLMLTYGRSFAVVN